MHETKRVWGNAIAGGAGWGASRSAAPPRPHFHSSALPQVSLCLGRSLVRPDTDQTHHVHMHNSSPAATLKVFPFRWTGLTGDWPLTALPAKSKQLHHCTYTCGMNCALHYALRSRENVKYGNHRMVRGEISSLTDLFVSISFRGCTKAGVRREPHGQSHATTGGERSHARLVWIYSPIPIANSIGHLD